MLCDDCYNVLVGLEMMVGAVPIGYHCLMSNHLSNDKDVRRLVKACENAGWTVVKCKSGHIRLCPPDGGMVHVISSTPSSPNDFQCNARRLRKLGVKI